MSSFYHFNLGYSGSDLSALAKEAAMGPIRDVPAEQVLSMDAASVRPIQLKDFEQALRVIKASVSLASLQDILAWNETFGSVS